ncbi:hypothetical protein QO010_000356 [Caulobacter ginsengisoli]|uniref:Uncharacterized protein n=1 Tax=Caulobacter ginsengisoli TaxID=400775 RepID=A0ABU0IKS1_9CAUL|nr:hypothetical protein [Caulobacter ginsengisoli]MDQ0462608.1 hypothetical protein [Caulobacter ginsengisoli]
MRELLTQAHAQLTHALSLVEAARQAHSPERAGNLAHDADLQCLEAANTLSAAFGAAAEMQLQALPPPPTATTPRYPDAHPR